MVLVWSLSMQKERRALSMFFFFLCGVCADFVHAIILSFTVVFMQRSNNNTYTIYLHSPETISQ